VQEQAIPLVLSGRDLMAGAQTGTGKTAAFALPILQKLAVHASASASPARHPVRALVLTPTRELAVQVADSFRGYSKHLPLRSTVVYGGVDMNAQIEQLRKGVEVLVATPGRLLDHVQNKTVMFSQVSILVLDEADRMLDMGFLPDIKRIIALLPGKRQNLLFSATFPDEIRSLAKGLLTDPAEVQIAARNAVADLVSHVLHPVAREKKRELLAYLVQTRELRQVLVFTGTRIGANRLAHQLRRDHIHADAIHGDKTLAEREAALEMIANLSRRRARIQLAANKAYDEAGFVAGLRKLRVTPQVTQYTGNRSSAIDRRTSRHDTYVRAQAARRHIEKIFGWLKQVGGQRRTRFRGRQRVGWMFQLAAAAYNLVRMKTLSEATA
jgi:superfamily II DNA/RNA helicase